MINIHGEKAQHVLRAFFQNIISDEGHLVGFGIVIVKQAFPQTAAGCNDTFAVCLSQQAVDNGDTAQDNVGAFLRQARDGFAFFQRSAAQLLEQCAEALGTENVIMDPAGGIVPASLDHLGNGTGGAADTDQRQIGIFQPGILFHAGRNKVIDVAVRCRRHGLRIF